MLAIHRQTLVSTIVLFILAGCGPGTAEVGGGQLKAVLDVEVVTIVRGESVDVQVDIEGPKGVTVNGFNVDVL